METKQQNLANPIGRPSKMTPETVKKLEEAFSIDATVEEACFYADISRVTYYDWIKGNTELSNRFEALRQRPVLKARQTVVKSLDDPEMALKYLERKKKAEFSTRQELSGLNGKDLIPQPILGNTINVSADISHKENSQAIEAHTSDPGRDISQQNDIDSAIVDQQSATEGSTASTDLDSVGVIPASEARSDERLPVDNADTSILQGQSLE